MGLRVVIVEDDSLLRGMLANTLRLSGATVVAEYSTASEATALDPRLKPNVALLDLHLGKGPTGLDVALALRKRFPGIGVVFLTSFDDPRLLNPNLPELPKNSHYLTKSEISNIGSLLSALNDAALGIGQTKKAKDSKHPLANFSNAQLETLRLVAQGMSNAEIAKHRFVTERSVEVAISRIAHSLGLAADATRNQRVHMARVYFRAAGRSPSDEI